MLENLEELINEEEDSIRRAILESIQHWRDNASGKTKTFDAKDCALCEIYNQGIGQDCELTEVERCPVFSLTKKSGCHGTPYYAARHAALFEADDNFREQAKLEAEFLEKVLLDYDTRYPLSLIHI